MGRATDPRLSPRCAGTGVSGVVLYLRIGCLSSAALQVQHARRRLFLKPLPGPASTVTGEEARSRTRAGAARRTWVVLAASLKQDAVRCGASLLLSLLVVLVSRLLFGRRFDRSGPLPARIATGDARAMRALRVRHGWFSPPQSSTDVARVVLSSPLFFSRSVAPRATLP